MKHGVQELQAFAFCAVTVNDEHTKPAIIHRIFKTGFQQFFASIDKIFILGGRLVTKLYFREVLRFPDISNFLRS